MGKVFTVEEIRDGRYPEPGAHRDAAAVLTTELFKRDHDSSWFAEGLLDFESHGDEYDVDSGLVYGSTVHGTANIRSDLDVILVVDLRRALAVNNLRRIFNQITEDYAVPVEANIISLFDAHDGRHPFDPLLIRYLKTAQDDPEFSWGWPIDLMTVNSSKLEQSPLHIASTVRSYIAAKNASFAKALVIDGALDTPKQMHVLQRALELPKNLGRKVLSMSDESFSVQTATEQEITERLIGFIGDHVLNHIYAAESLNYVVSQDRAYTNILEQAIAGSMSLDQYKEWIEHNEREIIWRALQVGESVAMRMERHIDEVIRSGAQEKFLDEYQEPGPNHTIQNIYLGLQRAFDEPY